MNRWSVLLGPCLVACWVSCAANPSTHSENAAPFYAGRPAAMDSVLNALESVERQALFREIFLERPIQDTYYLPDWIRVFASHYEEVKAIVVAELQMSDIVSPLFISLALDLSYYAKLVHDVQPASYGELRTTVKRTIERISDVDMREEYEKSAARLWPGDYPSDLSGLEAFLLKNPALAREPLVPVELDSLGSTVGSRVLFPDDAVARAIQINQCMGHEPEQYYSASARRAESYWQVVLEHRFAGTASVSNFVLLYPSGVYVTKFGPDLRQLQWGDAFLR